MTETTVPPGAGVDHPVARAIGDAITGLSSVTGTDGAGVWQLSAADCLAVKARVNELSAMLAAVDLQVVGELDARQVTVEVAGVNTVAWLHAHCQQSLVDARADVALARGLRGRFAGVAAGMSAGMVSKKQAQAIVSVLAELPDELDAEEVVKAEEAMVGSRPSMIRSGCGSSPVTCSRSWRRGSRRRTRRRCWRIRRSKRC